MTTTPCWATGRTVASGGDGTNDFDFYSVDVAAGQTLAADTEGSAAGTDTILVVYDAAGEPLAADDDSGTGFLSSLTFTPDAPGHLLRDGRRLRLSTRCRPTPSTPAAAPAVPTTGAYRVSIASRSRRHRLLLGAPAPG